MKHDHSTGDPQTRGDTNGPCPQRPLNLRIAFWALLAIAAFYLLAEHRAHLVLGLPYLSFLPFLLLAVCPLLHMYGHGGHGGHGGHREPTQQHPPESNASSSGGSTPDATERKADDTHRHGGDLP